MNSQRIWQEICCLSQDWTNRDHELMAKSPAIRDAQGRFITLLHRYTFNAELPKSSAFLRLSSNCFAAVVCDNLLPVNAWPRTPDLPALKYACMRLFTRSSRLSSRRSIKTHFLFDSLRSHQRFADVVQKMELPK